MSGRTPIGRLAVVTLATAIAVVPGGLAAPGASLAATSTATFAAPQIRQVSNLDAGWKFLRSDAAGAQAPAFNDSSWSAIDVPHTWNALDGQDGGNNYYRGIGWYRRHVTPSAALAGKRLWLQFDGANTVTDVWVNGTRLGTHQ
ncbi:MAG TPA: hypothetical protein VJX66_00630, partial [Amycolatopsis sp.]|nr:hypothetical protein [Amycolatopsis sp.]